MNHLEPCPQCHRHVLVSETACPFCSYSLGEAFANIAPRVLPRARLGRAAMFAFGALAISQGACASDGRSPPDAVAPIDAGPVDSAPFDADDDGGVAIYSAAPTKDAATAKDPATANDPATPKQG